MKIFNWVVFLFFILFLTNCGSNSETNNNTADGISLIATDSTTEKGKIIFAKCIGCHGHNAEKHALEKSDIIAGQEKEGTIFQLKEYRAGRLNQYGLGDLMKGQVAELSDEDITNVAIYIESLVE